MTYAAAARAVADARSIVLTSHVNPDGDGIGCCLALAAGLKALKKRVRIVLPSVPAGLYAFLPGFDGIDAVLDEAAAAALPRCDLLLSSDCGSRDRLGAVAAMRHGKLLNLDHHASNTRFGGVNLVDVTAASSGAVVDPLLRRLGVPLTRAIAECLYTTLVFDTGRFMHSNTDARAFRFAARLMDAGVDAALINRKLTYTRTPADLARTQLAIERLLVDAEQPRLAGIALSAADVRRVGRPDDWGDLVEIPRSLAGNEVAYLLRESDDGSAVRVSLRSNPPYAVGPVAEGLGGGGHLQAAGCTVSGPLAAAQAQLLPLLRAVAVAG